MDSSENRSQPIAQPVISSNFNQPKKSGKNIKKVLFVVFVSIIVSALAVVGLGYKNQKDTANKLNNQLKESTAKVNDLEQELKEQRERSDTLQKELDKLLEDAKEPQTNEKEVKETVEKVSKLISIPLSETPTIATIVDKTKLQNQDFFKNAENGDKILMFSNAKLAVLYRPSENKIITQAPIHTPN